MELWEEGGAQRKPRKRELRRREVGKRDEGAQEEGGWKEGGGRLEKGGGSLGRGMKELRRRENGHSTCWSHSSVSAPLQVFRTLKQDKEEAAGVGRAGIVCPQQDTRITLLSHLLHLPLVASTMIRHWFCGQPMRFCHIQGAVY